MMPTFSSLVAPEVVEMATFGVSGNQTTHGFHSICGTAMIWSNVFMRILQIYTNENNYGIPCTEETFLQLRTVPSLKCGSFRNEY